RRAGHRPDWPALRHPPRRGRGRHRPRRRQCQDLLRARRQQALRTSGRHSRLLKLKLEPEAHMPDLPQLLLFIAAGWLLNLTPGPGVLYLVPNALKSGVRAGLVAALGIVSGCFVHVFAAAIGVSALLATSAAAFIVLKWVGAAYLLWMGVRLLLSRAT